MSGRLHAMVRDQRGSALIEFALIGTVMIMLLVGGYEAATAVRATMKTNAAALTMAELVAMQNAVNNTSMANFCNGAKLVMTPLSNTTLKIAVASVTKNATSGTTAVDWSDTTCGSASSIASTAISLSSGLIPNNGDSVIVSYATYTYDAASSFMLPATITLSQIAFGRPRNIAQIPHN